MRPAKDLGCLTSIHACRMQRCAQQLHIHKTKGTSDTDIRLLGFATAAIKGRQHTQLTVQRLMCLAKGMMNSDTEDCSALMCSRAHLYNLSLIQLKRGGWQQLTEAM